MCEAHRHADAPKAAGHKADLAFHVQEMTCGHCAGVITSALTKTFPGVSVHADTASRIVYVDGAKDAKAVGGIIAEAGYAATVVS
jgi:copper chaperone